MIYIAITRIFASATSKTTLISLTLYLKTGYKCILGHILGMSSDNFWLLQLKEGALSVIHYPSADSPPVLQGINISEAAMLSILSRGVNH